MTRQPRRSSTGSAWPFDVPTLRRIKRCGSATRSPRTAATSTGSIATLAPDCVYEIVPTGQRWEGHAGARAFYTELFAAFPDNAFELTDIVIGPQGVFEVGDADAARTSDRGRAPRRADCRCVCASSSSSHGTKY